MDKWVSNQKLLAAVKFWVLSEELDRYMDIDNYP